MANPDITVRNLAIALRLHADPATDPPQPLMSVLTGLHASCAALIQGQNLSLTMPVAIANETLIRLAAYLYTLPAGVPGQGFAAVWRNCGAATLTEPWRTRRFELVEGSDQESGTSSSGGDGVDATARAGVATNARAIRDEEVARATADNTIESAVNANAAKLQAPSDAEADAATANSIRGWAAAKIRRVVEAIVPAWARAASPPSSGGDDVAGEIADLEHRTADLSVTTHNDWVNVTQLTAGAFDIADINRGGEPDSYVLSHTADSPGPSDFYDIRLRIPLGLSPAAFRLTVNDVPVTGLHWSEDTPDNTYRYFDEVGGAQLLPRGGTVRLQMSTRVYHTEYAGDLTAEAKTRLFAGRPSGGDGLGVFRGVFEPGRTVRDIPAYLTTQVAGEREGDAALVYSTTTFLYDWYEYRGGEWEKVYGGLAALPAAWAIMGNGQGIPFDKLRPFLFDAEVLTPIAAAAATIAFDVNDVPAGEVDAATGSFDITADQANEPGAQLRVDYDMTSARQEGGRPPSATELVLRHAGSGVVVATVPVQDYRAGHATFDISALTGAATLRWAMRVATKGRYHGSIAVSNVNFHSTDGAADPFIRRIADVLVHREAAQRQAGDDAIRALLESGTSVPALATRVDALEAKALPAFPAPGSRNDKIPKFADDVLNWEEDAGAGGGGMPPTEGVSLSGDATISASHIGKWLGIGVSAANVTLTFPGNVGNTGDKFILAALVVGSNGIARLRVVGGRAALKIFSDGGLTAVSAGSVHNLLFVGGVGSERVVTVFTVEKTAATEWTIRQGVWY